MKIIFYSNKSLHQRFYRHTGMSPGRLIRYSKIRNQCRFQCESALVKLVLFSLVTPFGKKQFACTCTLIVL